jgi:hypothetical protein
MGQSERLYAGTRPLPQARPEWTVVAIILGGGDRGGGLSPSPHKPDPGSLLVAKSGRFLWEMLAEIVHYFEVSLFLNPRQKVLL